MCLMLNTVLLLRKAFPNKLMIGFPFRIMLKNIPACLPQAEMETESPSRPCFPPISQAKE